jgi:hypothetical protein
VLKKAIIQKEKELQDARKMAIRVLGYYAFFNTL